MNVGNITSFLRFLNVWQFWNLGVLEARYEFVVYIFKTQAILTMKLFFDEMLEERVDDASRRNIQCIIAGDCNAKVGAQEEFDDARVVGEHGVLDRSVRVDFMLNGAL